MPTHFIRRLNMREQLIRQVEIIPLEVVVRNVAAGSFAKRFGIEEGTQLPRSIMEFFYKNDALGDPMVTEEHITAFGWATPQDLDDIVALTLARERLPVRPVPRLRHQADRLQARVRPPMGGRHGPHRACRRDQPGLLPAVGHARPTRRWTRTASAATSARSRKPIRRWRAARHPHRPGAGRRARSDHVAMGEEAK